MFNVLSGFIDEEYRFLTFDFSTLKWDCVKIKTDSVKKRHVSWTIMQNVQQSQCENHDYFAHSLLSM